MNLFTLTFAALGRNHIASTLFRSSQCFVLNSQIPLDCVSSKLIVNCLLNCLCEHRWAIHERFLPSPTQPQRALESPGRIRSLQVPTWHPILRANSFPKFTDLFCRLFLPTLFYWPEAAHLGDLLWLWVWMHVKINLSLGFSRAFKSAPDTRKSVVLYWPLTYLLAIRFYGVRSLTRKENSSLGSCRCLRVQLRYHKSGPKGPEYPCCGLGILTQFPFDKWPMIGHFETKFSCLLRLTNPYPTAVLMESFSTSIFKVLIWIFATTTKICTRGRFTQAHAKGFTTTPTPSYSSELRYLLWRLSIGTTLERHPFSGLVDSAGVLLHTP